MVKVRSGQHFSFEHDGFQVFVGDMLSRFRKEALDFTSQRLGFATVLQGRFARTIALTRACFSMTFVVTQIVQGEGFSEQRQCCVIG